VSRIKKECPNVPLVLYINGNGGLLERMKNTGVDVIGLDWTVDMTDGRRRLGNGISVQGNVDPAFLFSPLPVLTDEIHRLVKAQRFPFNLCYFVFLLNAHMQFINEITSSAA
jgi:uroporphyrinogen decarboxylase